MEIASLYHIFFGYKWVRLKKNGYFCNRKLCHQVMQISISHEKY